MPKPIKRQVIQMAAVVAVSTMMSSAAFASAFQSFEQNASGLGEADAGASSIANDATTEFQNPAGMTRLKKTELDVSEVFVKAHTTFRPTKSKDPAGHDVHDLKGKTTQSPLGGAGMPGMHLVVPFQKRWWFGFGITVPYGFQSRYDGTSVARYVATKSRLETINVNPSIAYKINRHWSVGFGISAQQLEAQLDQAIQTSFIMGNDLYQDMYIKNDADNWGVGVNGGILFELNSNTRFGLSYRSQVFHHLKGKGKLYYPDDLDQDDINYLKSQGYSDSNVSSKIIMPAMGIFSGYHRINPHWAVMGSVTYTAWHVFRKLSLKFNNEDSNSAASLPTATTIEKFRDTFKYGLGVNYIQNSKTTWRAGVAYDMTPIRKRYRTVRLPDTNRYWLTFGLHKKYNKHLSFDLAYARIFFQHSRVDQKVNLNPELYYEVAGNYRHSYANLVGLQVNWMFG